MTLGVQVRLLIYCHEYIQQCYKVYAYVTRRSTSRLKVYTNDTCHWYAQDFSSPWILKRERMINIFFWQTKMQHITSSI